jgi:D-arabinose 1-dehydrogenase-like Zn-dependent alcohol dehydrogenase
MTNYDCQHEKTLLSNGTYNMDGYTSASTQTTTLPKTMRALCLLKESSSSQCTLDKISLRLVTVPIPAVPPGSVLVQIYAAAINPSDVVNATGYFPYTTYPRIPGRDFAGRVVFGPDHLQGLRVFGTSGHDFSFTQDGAHAEYCVVPEDSSGRYAYRPEFHVGSNYRSPVYHGMVGA